MKPFNVDPRNIPDEGLTLNGSLPATIFDLDSQDTTQAAGPLNYDITVIRDEDSLIITGEISALFELQCGRCTERFQTEITLNPYGQDIPLENDSHVDLTSTLREDILLALPNYPRCETGTVTPRECPADGQFDAPQESPESQSDQPENGKVWEALDHLNKPNSN